VITTLMPMIRHHLPADVPLLAASSMFAVHHEQIVLRVRTRFRQADGL
jgi:hypothetical protein